MKPRTTGEQAKFKREVFHTHKKVDEGGRIFLQCCFCGGRINPAIESWDAAHGVAHFFGGKDGAPAHPKCHRVETSTKDVPAIAKSKRQTDKHFGIKRRGWGSKWKKKLSGETVPR